MTHDETMVFLRELEDAGVSYKAENGMILAGPASSLTETQKALIRANKVDLMATIQWLDELSAYECLDALIMGGHRPSVVNGRLVLENSPDESLTFRVEYHKERLVRIMQNNLFTGVSTCRQSSNKSMKKGSAMMTGKS